jgi:hypothetical protein
LQSQTAMVVQLSRLQRLVPDWHNTAMGKMLSRDYDDGHNSVPCLYL